MEGCWLGYRGYQTGYQMKAIAHNLNTEALFILSNPPRPYGAPLRGGEFLGSYVGYSPPWRGAGIDEVETAGWVSPD